MRQLPLLRLWVSVALMIGASLFVAIHSAHAGADAVKLLVKHVNSGRTFEITEPSLLGFMAFADLTKPLSSTPQMTDGYEITRYWPNGPFDHFHYYPGTETTPGYIFYDGFIQGWSDSDGKWYQVRETTDRAMHDLLSIPAKGPTLMPSLRPVGVPAAVAFMTLTTLMIIFVMRRNGRLRKREA